MVHRVANRRVRLVVFASGVVALLTVFGSGLQLGQANARQSAVKLVVSPSRALIDQQVDVRVTGLRRGQKVALVATAQDGLGIGWRSRLVFIADGHGRVETRSQMKLFWSMLPAKGSDQDASFAFTRPEMPVLTHSRQWAHRCVRRPRAPSAVPRPDGQGHHVGKPRIRRHLLRASSSPTWASGLAAWRVGWRSQFVPGRAARAAPVARLPNAVARLLQRAGTPSGSAPIPA
jgi:hypothetical protein